MKIFVIFLFATLVFRFECAPQESTTDDEYDESDEEISDKNDSSSSGVYSYNYEVNHIDDKLFFNKSEKGDENGKVSGTFSVLRADGKLMTVEYFATEDEGFVPRITIKDNIDEISDEQVDENDSSEEKGEKSEEI